MLLWDYHCAQKQIHGTPGYIRRHNEVLHLYSDAPHHQDKPLVARHKAGT